MDFPDGNAFRVVHLGEVALVIDEVFDEEGMRVKRVDRGLNVRIIRKLQDKARYFSVLDHEDIVQEHIAPETEACIPFSHRWSS